MNKLRVLLTVAGVVGLLTSCGGGSAVDKDGFYDISADSPGLDGVDTDLTLDSITLQDMEVQGDLKPNYEIKDDSWPDLLQRHLKLEIGYYRRHGFTF